MRALIVTAMVLSCSVCASPIAALADPPRGSVYTNLERVCPVYTNQVMIDGQPYTVYGHACLQPDGSYRIMHDEVTAPPASVGASGQICQEQIGPCDRSCDNLGILGARHIHADCSRTCDLICGNREGYAPW